MVIEVTYQSRTDASDPHAHFKQTKHFEVNQVPTRDVVAQRLRNAKVDFDESTLFIRPCDDDAETMRKGGFTVLNF